MKTLIKVPIFESEKGYGTKIDDYMICLNTEKAKEFIKEFNKKNVEEEIPTWYMYAKTELIPFNVSDKRYEKVEKKKKQRMWFSDFKKK